MSSSVASKLAAGKHHKKPSDAVTSNSYQPPSTNLHSAILDLQSSAGNRAVNTIVNSLGGGAPLPMEMRGEMEQRFGADFSRVRLHTDAHAAQSATELNAEAYTVGNNIVFNKGRFSSISMESRRLLAHELAHVVQQSRGGASSPTLDGSGCFEAAARTAAAEALSGSGPVNVVGATAPGVACEPKDEKHKEDPNVVARLKALATEVEGKDVNNVQGDLFQRLVNEDIRGRIKDHRDIITLLPPGIAVDSVKFVEKHPNDLAVGEATFIESTRDGKPYIQIRTLGEPKKPGEKSPPNIKSYSDGTVFVMTDAGLVLKVVEAKSGERRKSEFWRGARDDDSQKKTWPKEQLKVRHEERQGLHDYDPDDPSVGRTPTLKQGSRNASKDPFIETERGGQFRADLEALEGGTLLVGGKEVNKVLTNESKVGFLAVTPYDVDISSGLKKLNEQGLRATGSSVPITAAAVRTAAKQVAKKSTKNRAVTPSHTTIKKPITKAAASVSNEKTSPQPPSMPIVPTKELKPSQASKAKRSASAKESAPAIPPTIPGRPIEPGVNLQEPETKPPEVSRPSSSTPVSSAKPITAKKPSAASQPAQSQTSLKRPSNRPRSSANRSMQNWNREGTAGVQNAAAEAVGEALGDALETIRERGIRYRTDEEIAKLTPKIKAYQEAHPTEGVLIAVQIQTWDPNWRPTEARPTRSFVSVVPQFGGKSKDEAIDRWQSEPKFLEGPSEGSWMGTDFVWIPPGHYVPLSKNGSINGRYVSSSDPTRVLIFQFEDTGTIHLNALDPRNGSSLRVEVISGWQIDLKESSIKMKARFNYYGNPQVIESEFRRLDSEWIHEHWRTNSGTEGDALWQKIQL